MQVLDDGAAIYCHAGHHEVVGHNVVYAVESPMGMGLYFDDEEMDSVMEGNLVYRCPDRQELNGHSAVVHLHHNGRNRVIDDLSGGGAGRRAGSGGWTGAWRASANSWRSPRE